MDDFVDKKNTEKAVNTYDKFVSAEVCFPDNWGRKMMYIVTKRVKDNNGNSRRIEHTYLFANT